VSHVNFFYVALAVLSIGAFPILLNRPMYAVFAYITLIFWFPNVGWGVAQGAELMNLYSRGTGKFYFSIVNLYLFGLFALSVFYSVRNSPGLAACNLLKYFLFFFVMLLVQAAYGSIEGITPAQILNQYGTINLVNTGLIVVVLIRFAGTPKHANQLATLILASGIGRGLFGMARYLFANGDIANVYENVQKAGIKLTYFDINDSMLACMAATIAMWRFFAKETPNRHRVFYLGVLVLEVFIAAFSYRRTAWGGLALAATLFCFLQPARIRVPLLASGVAAGGLGLTALIVQRFSQVTNGRGALDMLLYDVSGSVKQGRFAELYQAFLTVTENPLLGVGPWGGYGGNGAIQFMHSGIMHVWLKAGLVGLIPFILLFVSFIRFCIRGNAAIPYTQRALFWAGATSVLFTAPNILMGTPIIEFRTMQMTGICFALPYVAYGAFANTQSYVGESQPRSRFSHGFLSARKKLIETSRAPVPHG
jgi:hypothetical protein